MSPLQKGVKTPGFWFSNHIPALPARRRYTCLKHAGRHAGGKDGASDLSYVPYNSGSYPDISCPACPVRRHDCIGVGKNDRNMDAGVLGIKTNGIYPNKAYQYN